MNIYKRACSLILSLLLIFSLFSSTLAVQTYAATNPALSAESKSVNAGEQFTVAVNIANATSVYGGNFTLQYDSNLLTADSYTFGSIVGSHTKNCNLDYQSAGNLIRFTFSGASALTSSGTLVTFTFTAKQSVSGSAALQFTAYKMYDENGSAITSTASSAAITISSKPVVSPSISITNKTVTVGETVSVPVMISNSSDVYGGNFTLQYDSSLLTAESYSFGSIVSGHTKNCNLDYQSAGNLIRVTFSGAEAINSDGTLVTFTFTAKATGTATLEFTAYKMYDENGSSIYTSASESNVIISPKPNNIITGSCGTGVTGELNLDTGVLTISGAGALWEHGDNDGVFSTYKESIRKIIINNGITRIGTCNFDNYDLLAEVIISESVVEIGARAFRDCDSLNTVIIPDSVTKIDFECFAGCDNLTTVNLPNGISILNDNLFYNCPSLESIIIPNNVIEIKHGVFGSTGIKSIDIQSSVQRIGDDAFIGCETLERVTLNEGLLSIGKRTFIDCPKLLEICIPKSVVTIADDEWGHAFDLATTIYGYRNSVAQTYAIEWGNEFIPLDLTELVAISVYTLPNKTNYYIGDSLNTSGLVLRLTYGDGSTETVSSGFTTIGFSSSSAGTKTVTVSYEGKTTTIAVTVNTPSISLSSTSKSMTVGGTATLTATTTPSGQNVTWTSSDTSVATVSGGVITAKAVGSATITAKFTYNGITYSKTCSVTVSNPVVTISSISLYTNPTKTTYYIGDSLNTSGLTLKLTYSNGSIKTVTSGFTTSGFSSSSAGTKTVTVSYEGKTTTFTVTVNTPTVALSSTSKSMTAGDTATLTAITTPSGQTVTWTSSNTSVATVSGGTITAKASGSATITAEFSYNGITYSDNCEVTISSHNHSYTSKITKEATCITDGIKTYTCSCGDSYTVTIPATRHSYDNDCDTTCNVCGATRSITHAYGSWKTTKAATCTTDGVKERTCSVCGKDETAVLTKLGHDYATTYTVDKVANCTATGSKSRHCTRCDAKTDVTVIPVTEHSYTTSVVKPTCTENGYTSYLCKNCGNSYKANYTISTGHTPGEWIIDKKSDCTHGGTKHQVCSICGETIKTQTIPMAEHKYVDTVTKPTCTTDGFTTHTCSVCGDSYTDHVVKAKGHSEKSTVTKATMTKDGKIVTICTVCKKNLKSTPIYKASSIKLSGTSYIYNGKVQKPTITVKNSKGTTLKNGTDYTVTYSSGCKNTGKYAVKVTFKGNYSGAKTLYFNILPGKTTSLTAAQSTTAIKATWKSVAGVSGYKVTLYNSSGKAVKTVDTTKTTYTFSKLSKGTTYKVRVTAYKTIDGKKVLSSVYTLLTTATKPGTPTLKVTAGSKKATLSWNKQTGATGYVVYMATSKNGKYTKIATVKGNGTVSFTKTGLTKGKTYYFKVAAYETVGGKNIYGSFSSVKYAKIK